MALSEFALASLIIVVWMFYSDKLRLADNIVESTGQGVMVTNTKGVIQKVNPAFSAVTGYQKEEAVGQTPRLLRSGRHDRDFYEEMWKKLKENGYWQGEIWNKRKNGEEYLEWLTISAVKNDAGEVMYFVAIFSDISQKT